MDFLVVLGTDVHDTPTKFQLCHLRKRREIAKWFIHGKKVQAFVLSCFVTLPGR